MDTITILKLGDESEILSFAKDSPFPVNIRPDVFESPLTLVISESSGKVTIFSGRSIITTIENAASPADKPATIP